MPGTATWLLGLFEKARSHGAVFFAEKLIWLMSAFRYDYVGHEFSAF